MAINWAFFVVNLVLQVIVTIIFITSFFFTYVSSIEKSIVVDQVSDVIRDFNTSAILFLPSNIIPRNSSENSPDTSADAEVQEKNAALRHKIIIQLIVIGVLGLGFVIAGTFIFKLDVRELLLNCTFSLIAVFIAEFVFATFFAKNYKTLDENMIKSKIIGALQSYSKMT